MENPKILNQKELQGHIKQLDGWLIEKKSIKKEWKFQNFIEAFAFMTKVALLAESIDHHPNWNNVYSSVIIELTTHDFGGITKKDIELATAINNIE